MAQAQPHQLGTFGAMAFLAAWLLITSTMLVVCQVASDRLSFWASIGIEPQSGRIEVLHLEEEQGRLFKYTIATKGLDGAPDLAVEKMSRHPTLSLGKLYLALQDDGPGAVVPVRWIEPRWGEPHYIEADGRSLATRRDWLQDAAWVFLTGMSLVLLVAGPLFVGYGLYTRTTMIRNG